MARATNHDNTNTSVFSFVVIDFALFLAAGVLGTFAKASLV